MPDSWTPERRRDERRDVPFPLYARVRVGSDADDARVRVRGVSVGGMVLESPGLLPVNQRASVVLSGPDGDIGPLAGCIVHSRLVLAPHRNAASAYIAGLAFDSLPAASADAIEALLFSIAQHPSSRNTRQLP